MKTQAIFALLFLSASVFTFNKGASIEEQRSEESIDIPLDLTEDHGIGQLASKQLDKDIIDLMIIFNEDVKMNHISGGNIETEELEQGDTASTLEEGSNNLDDTTGIATRVIRLREENFASHDYNKHHYKNFRLHRSCDFEICFLWICSGPIKDLRQHIHHDSENLVCTGCYENSFCEELCKNNIIDILAGLDGLGTCDQDTIYELESYKGPETA